MIDMQNEGRKIGRSRANLILANIIEQELQQSFAELLMPLPRPALAEQPVGPTDEELRELRRQHDWPVVDSLLFSIARAVLARWGQS